MPLTVETIRVLGALSPSHFMEELCDQFSPEFVVEVTTGAKTQEDVLGRLQQRLDKQIAELRAPHVVEREIGKDLAGQNDH
jgi:RNA binding exosome subunit